MHLPATIKGTAPYLLLVVLLALTALVRSWNHAEVFVANQTFFVDGDCYSRMTRVRQVMEHPGTVVHQHHFENWPDGTQPHTTAPFDYLTAALVTVLRPFMPNLQSALDRAGALISPLLGLLTVIFLWAWAGRLGLPYRVPMVILFAISPILVHGTVLGRPDHQSLLILCMAVAIGGEVALLVKPAASWAVACGLAWGLGLWVSLYEPAVLFLGVMLIKSGFRVMDGVKRQHGTRNSILLLRFGLCASVLLVALVVDGWHSPVPDPETVKFFPNWSRTIGELNHGTLPVLFRWTCALLPFSALLLLQAALGWPRRDRDNPEKTDRIACFWLILLVLTLLLTCWQLRWGYFLALVFVMGLPWQLELLARWNHRVVIPVFVASLLPLLLEWNGLLRPDANETARRVEQRVDNLALYDVAEQLRGPLCLPVLAPWWQSPALAYWSSQPCVAGSSHESLPGTLETARFFLCEDQIGALAILNRRKVACVVVYDPSRIVATSCMLLGINSRGDSTGNSEPNDLMRQAMGPLLYRQSHRPPPFLELAYSNAAFRVFLRRAGVDPGGTPTSPGKETIE